MVILGHRPKIWTCLSTILILDASCMKHKFWQENSSKKRVRSYNIHTSPAAGQVFGALVQFLGELPT